MTTINAKASIAQSTDSDERHVRVEFYALHDWGQQPLGRLTMPLDVWRSFRHVLTVPDCPDEDAPDVAVIIEERHEVAVLGRR